MPDMKQWMSPKRRKTTGNLKNIPNGQYASSENDASSERPSTASPRPLSQPSASSGASSDGNLFYAYARRGDDLRTRYLLTFASASIANEWWLLIQAHFPDCTRPGPQLFSFKTEDLLPKAWKHPGFGHLKTKWMYISFSDTSSEGIGGAVQGIIPVQDERGNMLGGSAGVDASPAFGEAKKELTETKEEVKETKNEIGRLEEHFEKMMSAVERNTEGLKQLAEEQHGTKEENREPSRGGYFDASGLEAHFGRMNDLMAKNMEHVENLAKRQFENEQKLRQDDVSAKTASGSGANQIDFSPLTERMEKMQYAVEENSGLIKTLLGGDDQQTPRWRDQQQIDLLPLLEHLTMIHGAIEKQSSQMETFSSSRERRKPEPLDLSPLAKHLEGLQQGSDRNAEALERLVRSSPLSVEFSPMVHKLDAIHKQLVKGNDGKAATNDLQPLKDQFQELIDTQNATREAIEANSGEWDVTPLVDQLDGLREAVEGQHAPLLEHLQGIHTATDRNAELFTTVINTQLKDIDFSAITDRLDGIRVAVENNSADIPRAIDFGPLAGHLEAIREATDSNAEQIKSMVETQRLQTPSSTASDFTPLTERLNKIHASLERANKDAPPGSGDPKFVLNALSSHLSKIQALTESNAQAIKKSLQRPVVPPPGNQRLDAMESQVRELMAGQREMTKVVRELAQAITAQNKGSCDHVVIPPPRKVGRKIVGFVYDGKEEVV